MTRAKVLRLVRSNITEKNVSFTPSVMWCEVQVDVPGKGQIRRFYNEAGLVVMEAES
jgi:hypothetical protein